MVYCLNVYDDTVLWDKAVSPGVDRLAISPDGGCSMFQPGEDGAADYINVVDADTGNVLGGCISPVGRTMRNTRYRGRCFRRRRPRTAAATYLYLVDPRSYAVSRIGPLLGVLGPYAVDSKSITR